MIFMTKMYISRNTYSVLILTMEYLTTHKGEMFIIKS